MTSAISRIWKERTGKMLHTVSAHIRYLEADHRSDRPVLGYIQGSRRAFAVDAGASKAHVDLFYEELKREGLPLPDLTGISHYHWDHSYGAAFVHGLTLASDRCAAVLKEEVAYQWTPQAMRERLDQGKDIAFGYYSKLAEYPDLSAVRVVAPDLALAGNLTVDLGGVHVEVLYCGGPHSDDHLIFYIPEDRFLFLSDASGKELFTLDWTYDPQHPEQLQDRIGELPYNQEKLGPFVALLESLDFTRCSLGHEDTLWSRERLLTELKRHLPEK